MKQAYFRTLYSTQEKKLKEELDTIETILNEYISLQDTLFSEALILTEGVSEGTPRFLADKFVIEVDEYDDPLSSCLKSSGFIKKSLGRAMDIESAIVNQYKSFIEKHKLSEKRRIESEEENFFDLDECINCKESEETIEKLRQDLEKQKKINKNLNSQHNRLQSDFIEFKNMYNELTDAHEELLQELKRDSEHNEDHYELEKLSLFVDELKEENEKLLIENKEILKTKKTLEQNFSEFIKKADQDQSKVQKLQNSFEQCLEDNQSKTLTIEKAQIIIKKLNDECEKLAKELKKAEDEIEFLKKETRGIEKT